MRRNMYLFNRLTAIVLTAALLGSLLPLEAKTRKGDKYLAEGRAHEPKKEWDAALEDYEKALSEDPADIVYQMASTKARFQAAQSHIDKGLKLRSQGQLGDALLEFQKAYAINPGSAAATQEIRRTTEMIERERKRVQETGKESSPQGARPDGRRQSQKGKPKNASSSILPVPQLRPINPSPIHLRMNGSAKLLFETVAKVADINVLWDPEYQPQVKTNIPVEFENSTLEEALDYLAVITKSYWKPLSSNTIFITMDNPNKRRDYEEQVAKVFYLQNVNTPQELQEIVNAVRSVADIQRFFPYNAQNAIIAKGERGPGGPGRKDSARSGQAQERSRGGHYRDGSQFGIFAAAHRGHRLHGPQCPREFYTSHRAAGGHEFHYYYHGNHRHHGHNHYRYDCGDRHQFHDRYGHGHPSIEPGPSLLGGFFHHHPGRAPASGVERRQYEGAAIAATARRG